MRIIGFLFLIGLGIFVLDYFNIGGGTKTW